MLDAETQRRELQGVASCSSRITPTSCQFLSNPLSFNLLNRFSVTQTQVCFRQECLCYLDSQAGMPVLPSESSHHNHGLSRRCPPRPAVVDSNH